MGKFDYIYEIHNSLIDRHIKNRNLVLRMLHQKRDYGQAQNCGWVKLCKDNQT